LVSATASASVLAAPAPKDSPPPAAGPTRIGTCEPGADKRFTLAHVNDLQARYSDRIAGKSRYAYLAGYLRALKTERPATLVLDAGDDYEKGALAELRSNGETTRRMIQALPIDVRVIGNHDFAYGEDAVLGDLAQSTHPVLAANIKHEAFKPYARVDVGCVRVGVIGLVTQGFGADDRQTREPFCGVFAQDDHYVAIAQREIDAHRAEVDVMIALTHLGFSDDTTLAARTKGLDLIVGGHSEDLIAYPAPVRHADGTRTFIMQAGNYAEKIGRAEIVVGSSGTSIASYRIVTVNAKLPCAEDVDALAKTLEDDSVPDAHNVIGRVRAPIRQGKEMAELVRRAAIAQWEADIVVVGRDLFFSGLDRGEITLQRLYDSVLVQRQPSGTNGFSSLWSVDLSADEVAQLAKRFRTSWRYDIVFPTKLDPKKTYRVVMDKRALTYPAMYLGEITFPAATFRGEIIDVLEEYARARTAKNLTID
jgi:2',3'-cyclic-nucleotide 2'-phosphodiesterase (5'-nucleotidase family)